MLDQWEQDTWQRAIEVLELHDPRFVDSEFIVEQHPDKGYRVIFMDDRPEIIMEVADQDFRIRLRKLLRTEASELGHGADPLLKDPTWPALEILTDMVDEKRKEVVDPQEPASHPTRTHFPPNPPIHARNAAPALSPPSPYAPHEPFRGMSHPIAREDEIVAALGPEGSSAKMLRVCLRLWKMLDDKNRAYGDSALKPVRVFSRASETEQIRVRLDDKISRLARGSAAGEDVILDLMGYLVLLQVAESK